MHFMFFFAVANSPPHQLFIQYFTKLFGVPVDTGDRVVIAEHANDADAISLVGTHLIDFHIGRGFFARFVARCVVLSSFRVPNQMTTARSTCITMCWPLPLQSIFRFCCRVMV